MHTCFLTANPAPLPKPAKGFAFLPPGRKDKGRNEISSALICNASWPAIVELTERLSLSPQALGALNGDAKNLRHTNPLHLPKFFLWPT